MSLLRQTIRFPLPKAASHPGHMVQQQSRGFHVPISPALGSVPHLREGFALHPEGALTPNSFFCVPHRCPGNDLAPTPNVSELRHHARH
jgi:hypothetical protein